MTRKRLRWTLRIAATILLLIVGFFTLRWGLGNFGTVDPGKLYRSAQLSAAGLTRAIRDRGIRTVLNLRGQNPDRAWYLAERAATMSTDAVQVDFPMSSDQWLSREQARTLVDLLKTSPRPILVHCEWGAERTGLVSAIYELLQPGSQIENARGQFSAYYMFAPLKDGLVMRGHIDAYAAWLRANNQDHTPERFERWLTQAYEPGSPSREHWPCNPYPLKVVSRAQATPVTLWGERVCR